MEHLFKFCIGNVYIYSRPFNTWFYKYYTAIKQYVKIRNVTYMHLKIRGEIGTDTNRERNNLIQLGNQMAMTY